MPRLILKYKNTLRQLASVNVEHDGSIILNLIRKGYSESGFVWSCDGTEQSSLETRHSVETKTKDITIHTTGRINYKYDGSIRFIPCLLDLGEQIPIVSYSIPSIDKLDVITAKRQDDFICEFSEARNERLNFNFFVVPAVLPTQPEEQGRFGVEGLFALSWNVHIGDSVITRDDLPNEVFITSRPTTGLKSLTIREEVAYSRFRRAMYANDVISGLNTHPNKDQITAKHIEAMIQIGPGLYPPNINGVWTLITQIPMRITPILRVKFDDARYHAEVVDLRKGDTRLSTVRVRFKVYDKINQTYLKENVGISEIILDSEL